MRMDHKPLVYLNSCMKYMILDWLDFILDFDLFIVHERGINNILLDALSRLFLDLDDKKGKADKICEVTNLEVDDTPECLMKDL